MEVKNAWIKIGEQHVHLRRAGSGAPLVLLHASPSSSRMFIPFIQHLAEHYSVFAFDTPGYGKSQPLKIPVTDIESYTRFFCECFDKIGLEKFALYGSATGAQLAIRYGLSYPEQIEHLYLDNAADFSDEERTTIMKNYFPDLSPNIEGTHLDQTWKMVKGMFKYFPWFQEDEAHALSLPDLPASILHRVACDFLIAGAGYDRAYRAAFEHEKAEYVKALKVPTTVFRWAGSIILPYTDRLLDHEFNSNVQQEAISADSKKRFEEMTAHIKDTYTTNRSINFSPSHLQEITEEILPKKIKLTPSADGSHLKQAWQDLRNKEPNLEFQEFNKLFVKLMQAIC